MFPDEREKVVQAVVKLVQEQFDWEERDAVRKDAEYWTDDQILEHLQLGDGLDFSNRERSILTLRRMLFEKAVEAVLLGSACGGNEVELSSLGSLTSRLVLALRVLGAF